MDTAAPAPARPMPTARVGRRIVADLVDLALVGGVAVGAAAPMFMAAERDPDPWAALGLVVAGMAVGAIVGGIAWLVLGLLGGRAGRTPGMRLARLWQSTADGSRPAGAWRGAWSALLRHGALVLALSALPGAVSTAAEPDAWARPVAVSSALLAGGLVAAVWLPTRDGRSVADRLGGIVVTGGGPTPPSRWLRWPDGWRLAMVVGGCLGLLATAIVPTRAPYPSEARGIVDGWATAVVEGMPDAALVRCDRGRARVAAPAGPVADHREVESPCTEPPSTWTVTGEGADEVARSLAARLAERRVPGGATWRFAAAPLATPGGPVWVVRGRYGVGDGEVVAVVVDRDGLGVEPATGTRLPGGQVAVWLTDRAGAHHEHRVQDLLPTRSPASATA